MTKLLHVSDTHLGYRQYQSEERRSDFSDSFRKVVDIAIDEEVDAVIHTGDLFHSKRPNLQTQIEVARSLTWLDSEDIPFVAVVGNHERKRGSQFVDFFGISIDNLVSLEKRSPMTFGDVSLHGWDHIPSNRWDSEDLTLSDTETKWDIVAMHQLVHPPVPELFDPKDLDEIFDRFGRPPDMLLIGDYHERETITHQGVQVHYPGSTEMVASDEQQTKYVTILEFGEEMEVRRQEITGTRKFETVHVEFAPNEDAAAKVSRRLDEVDVEDAVVEVVLRGADLPIAPSRVHSIIKDNGAIVSRVSDERSVLSDNSGAVDYDQSDIEETIDNKILDRGVSDIGMEVDAIVRDVEEVKKSHVREEAREKMEEEL